MQLIIKRSYFGSGSVLCRTDIRRTAAVEWHCCVDVDDTTRTHRQNEGLRRRMKKIIIIITYFWIQFYIRPGTADGDANRWTTKGRSNVHREYRNLLWRGRWSKACWIRFELSGAGSPEVSIHNTERRRHTEQRKLNTDVFCWHKFSFVPSDKR